MQSYKLRLEMVYHNRALVLCSIAVCAIIVNTEAFLHSKLQITTGSPVQLRAVAPRSGEICMNIGTESFDRRAVLAAGAAILAGAISPLKNANAAGLAFGYGADEKDINAQLLAYSLAPIDKVRIL